MRRSWSLVLVGSLLTVLAALLLTACGSGSGSSSGTDESQSSTETTQASSGEEANQSTAGSEYDGPEAKLPTSFGEPTKKPGTKFKVGYLQVIGAIPQLATEERAAKAEVAALGGEMVSVDAELDLEKQAAGFEQLLTQNVDVIVGYPVLAKALGPQLKKAEAAGIPVITTSAQANAASPVPEGILADINQAIDYEAFVTMTALSEAIPGGSFTVMGLALPVESLEYEAERQIYWGKKFGLQFEGQIDTKEDNPEAYSAAATAIMGKYPNAEALVTYNELSALSSSTVAQTQGKSELLITGGSGGSEEAIEAVKAGRLFSTYALPWKEIGQELVRGAYNVLTKQNLPLPPRITKRGTLVTADNATEVEPTVEG